MTQTARSFVPEPLNRKSAAQAMLASLFWGGNMVALKIGLYTFPPFWSAWWRFSIGAVVLAVWAKREGLSLILRPEERRPLLVLGLLFTAQIILLNLGADMTSPAYSVVIMNAHPIFSNLLGHFVVSEQRLSPPRILGLTLAFGGICYLSFGRPVAALAPHPLTGNWLIVVSSLLLGIRTVYTRWVVQSIHPRRAVVWQCTVSLPIFLGGALLFEPALLEPVRWPAVTAILYQSVVIAGFCFIIWTTLLRRHSAGTLAMFGFTVPLFGVLLSALIFDEPITGRILIAAALVTAGMAIVLRSPATPVKR